MQVEIQELFDRLSICNNKLFEICNAKAKADTLNREELVALCLKDIALCNERSRLKNAIAEYFGSKSLEVKNYD